MGGKNSPDFGGLAIQQGEFNQNAVNQQTYANRPTQYTPWGYTSWDANAVRDPATGQQVTQWEQTQGLTPELQDILNKQIAIQGGRSDIAGMLTGRMGSEFGTPMNWDGLTPMGINPSAQLTAPEGDIGDPNAYRQRGSDAAYEAAMRRIQPSFAEQRRAAETRMRNQGLRPEDRAWQSQMEQLNYSENDARDKAIWGSEEAGRQESALNWGQQMGQNQNMFSQALGANQQNFSQALTGANYANQTRQQQIAEAMQQRGFSLNEINALLSGQQVQAPQMPSFGTAGSAAPPPVYQAGVSQGNFDQASSPWGGIANLAGTLGGAYIGTLGGA